MAQQVDGNASLIVAFGGWAVALLVALVTFVAQWRKGGVEETAVVLTKWKELVEAHERQISGFSGQIKALQDRVGELEDAVARKEEQIKKMRQDLAGERRQAEQREVSLKRELERLGHNNPDGSLRDA